MAHILAKISGVKLAALKEVLRKDTAQHAAQGLFLEYLWQNATDSNEVLFLFRTHDLERAQKFIKKVHTQALKENPRAKLPHMIFLKEK